ncbi:Acg family FMN-binding oxidoreductase [Kitasatospora sp. NPDC056327]|uniref:Acg family FMN-binding oxidoreductase n=1 Tax=Kitasatospora sp. NPDC056327 TaxID=3345785 RepID=UPI0035D52E4D
MTAQSALTPADLRLLAEAGGAAPSLHNSQPWRFRPTADGCGIEVHADPGRAVPLADANGAALHIAAGAALFNLRVAAAHLGRGAAVRLLPDPADPQLLAVLDLTPPATKASTTGTPTAGTPTAGPAGPFGRDLRDLHPAIAERHSSRQPFTNRDVPEAVAAELIAAAREEGVALAVLEEAGVRRVLAVTAEAEDRIAHDPARQAETRSWLRPDTAGAPGAVDGLPYAVLGPQDHDARVPMREFAGRPPHHDGPAQPSQRFEALPQLCTLVTPGDGPADWLRTGQALERVWLLVTLHGLRLTVWHQAVEWGDLRWRLRDPADGPGHVQLVLRVGYGPPGAATPRRPLTDVLEAPVPSSGPAPA